MSSFLNDSKDARQKLVKSELNTTVKEGEEDLFPHSNTKEEPKSKLDSDLDLSINLKQNYYQPKAKGGSSNRKYRMQSKNQFRGKNIETDFQLQRNDPLLNTSNILSNKAGTNQTMSIFASSNVASPIMSNMNYSKGFVVPSTTK